MSTTNKLDYAQLDKKILAWGVAQKAGDKFTVTAYRGRELAEKAASTAPRVTGTGTREQTGRTITFRNVEPLAYHHPDLGWVLAAVGWPLAT